MPYNTEAKLYTSAMLGSPVVNWNAGTLIALMNACLVDGWGLATPTSVEVLDNIATVTFATSHAFTAYSVIEVSGAFPPVLNGQHRVLSATVTKVTFEVATADTSATGTITVRLPPAGWERTHNGVNKAVYRSLGVSSTKTMFLINDNLASTSSTAELLLLESITDIDTFVGDGAYLRYLLKTNSVANRDWFVIANDRFCLMGIASTGYGYLTQGFGDFKSTKGIDPYRALVKGSHSTSNPSTLSYACNPFAYSNALSNNEAIARRDFSGLTPFVHIGFGELAHKGGVSGWLGSEITGAIPMPNPSDYGFYLSQLYIYEVESKCLRGSLPFIYNPLNYCKNAINNDCRTLAFLTDVAAIPGSLLVSIPCYDSTTIFYPFFIDINNPWGN